MSDNETKVSILPKVPKSIDNALENLTDLPTKGIGQTIADCWYLVFGGISQKADKNALNMQSSSKNLKPNSIRQFPLFQSPCAVNLLVKSCYPRSIMQNIASKKRSCEIYSLPY